MTHTAIDPRHRRRGDHPRGARSAARRRGLSRDDGGDGGAGPRRARRTAQFDAVLLDLMLPDRNGLEVLEDIRRHRRRAAGGHDHGVRHDRERRRRDQAGRVLLLHEAVQERRSAGRAAQRRRAAAARAREPRAARPAAVGLAPLRRDHRRQPEDARGLRPDRARGAEPRDGADSGRERHRQGTGRPRVSSPIGARRQGRSSPSTPATCRPICSSRTSSATSRARSPAPSIRRRACSSSPTRARSSSTRSATSRSTRRPSCCA